MIPGGQDRNGETLIGAHLAAQADEADVKCDLFEPLGGREIVGRRKGVKYCGQTGIEDSVKTKHIDLHRPTNIKSDGSVRIKFTLRGLIDIKDVVLDNGPAGPSPIHWTRAAALTAEPIITQWRHS